MASSLRLNFRLCTSTYSSTAPQPITTTSKSCLTVRCGPRDNRGPLYKGRVLSIEAIQAVQALKRADRADFTDDSALSRTLSRLIKSDLVAAFNELLRQDRCNLALKVFSTVRSEEWYKTDLTLYANLVSALARKGMAEDIDRLISDLEEEGVISFDKGLTTLIKALIAAGRAESTVRIYGLMKRSGWRSNCAADDYVAKILSRGLRRLGKGKVAGEIERELGEMSRSNLEKVKVLKLQEY